MLSAPSRVVFRPAARHDRGMNASRLSLGEVGAAEFARSMAALAPSDRIAVALSGGPDSLALLFLAARWAKRKKRLHLVAFTVDHGLRPESAKEARAAARLASSLGVAHRILKWKGEKPKTGLQAAARAARYALLAEACRKEKIGDLLVAHHLDDQAETFLLRLARGSGVDGLAAMAPVRDMLAAPKRSEGEPAAADIRLLRPLLGIARARLAATLAKAGLTAIADPSNENERFDRVKARRIMGELRALGLDARRLADTAANMARARAALEAETAALLSAHADFAPTGHVALDPAVLAGAPEEIALRALAELLRRVAGADYPPRFEALQALFRALKAGELARGRTLHGCKLSIERGRLLVQREPAAALKAPAVGLRPGEGGIWDGRFEVKLLAAPRGRLEVRALGPEGLSRLRKRGLPIPEAPKSALAALPALWKGATLLGAPHIGTLANGLRAEARSLVTAPLRRNATLSAQSG